MALGFYDDLKSTVSVFCGTLCTIFGALFVLLLSPGYFFLSSLHKKKHSCVIHHLLIRSNDVADTVALLIAVEELMFF